MRDFGQTVRDLRIAQELGLRETAVLVGISPAYLSRIERGKEHPPKPEVIKDIARVLGADPDVLFRLAASTDPEVTSLLQDRPDILSLIRQINEANFSEAEIDKLVRAAGRIKAARS